MAVICKEIYTSVNNLITGTWGIKAIQLIHLSDVEGAEEELKKILWLDERSCIFAKAHIRWKT